MNQVQHTNIRPKRISPLSRIPRHVSRNRNKRRGKQKEKGDNKTRQDKTAQRSTRSLWAPRPSAVSGSTRSNVLRVPFACLLASASKSRIRNAKPIPSRVTCVKNSPAGTPGAPSFPTCPPPHYLAHQPRYEYIRTFLLLSAPQPGLLALVAPLSRHCSSFVTVERTTREAIQRHGHKFVEFFIQTRRQRTAGQSTVDRDHS
ncbi:hypothetical protein LX36DRAFT_142909 [Colletotrichum falcatum]|nr:hypothetical protein LX36DRAFT_142909 [Colletotrichum falcatum]